jgi:hypothetical protein
MFGARPYLMEEYPDLSKNEAGQVLQYWMNTFSERHPPNTALNPTALDNGGSGCIMKGEDMGWLPILTRK